MNLSARSVSPSKLLALFISLQFFKLHNERKRLAVSHWQHNSMKMSYLRWSARTKTKNKSIDASVYAAKPGKNIIHQFVMNSALRARIEINRSIALFSKHSPIMNEEYKE